MVLLRYTAGIGVYSGTPYKWYYLDISTGIGTPYIQYSDALQTPFRQYYLDAGKGFGFI
jgi:hypothetical protein